MVPAGLTLARRVMLLRRRLACLPRWFGPSIVQSCSVVPVAGLFPGGLALRRPDDGGDRLAVVRPADLQADRSALSASPILGRLIVGTLAPTASLDRGDELARPPLPPLRARDNRPDDTVYIDLQRYGGKFVDRPSLPRHDQLHPDPGARTTDEHDAPQDLYHRRRIALGGGYNRGARRRPGTLHPKTSYLTSAGALSQNYPLPRVGSNLVVWVMPAPATNTDLSRGSTSETSRALSLPGSVCSVP